MLKLTSQQEAQLILNPHLPIVQKIMVESLSELGEAMKAVTESINNRAKCSLLHSLAIEKAKRYFDKHPDIIIKSKYQSIQIIFKQQLVGRVKKINDDKVPRNSKTKRNINILSQQLPLFPNMPQLTFIDLTYKVNSTWSEYDWLLVLCRINDNIQWEIDYKNLETIPVITANDEDILKVKEENQITIKKVI